METICPPAYCEPSAPPYPGGTTAMITCGFKSDFLGKSDSDTQNLVN